MSFRLSDPQGYASPAYFAALGQAPITLGRTGGTLVQRTIGGSDLTDLAGVWPLFSCEDWAEFGPAVADLPTGPVTLTLVPSPFCPLTPTELASIFPICRPLHDHWVIALTAPAQLSKHHRRKLRQTRVPTIQAGPASEDLAEGWAQLYAHLIEKKHIQDARAFSVQALAAQLVVPGAHVVTAWAEDELLGVDLYYLDRGTAFAHLSAYAPQGYSASVSYPMMAAAMEYFAPIADAINLGGAPGGASGPGIAHFKSGWTERTLSSFLCGKILDPAAYAVLAPEARAEGWFPAYRAGEYRS